MAERLCLHVVDAALLGSVFLVPCLLGGRIAIGHFALACCAILATFAWAASLVCGRQSGWILTRVEPLLIAIIGLGLLQITPLPEGIVQQLSPHQSSRLSLWNHAEEPGFLGKWLTLSLHTSESRSALMIGLSEVLLFYVATQRMRRIHDVEQSLRWIACASGGMALFGVAQWLTNNGKFFWFFDYPLTDPSHRMKGSFTNRNHFAQFLVLGCGPLLLWITRLLDARRSNANQFGVLNAVKSPNDTVLAGLLVTLGVLLFAVLFSLSRGGAISLCVSMTLMLLMLFQFGKMSGRVLWSLGGMLLVSFSLFLMMGYEKVTQRLDHWKSDSRLAIWQANLEIFADFPLIGTGAGSHAEAYPMYFDPPFGETEFTHAENSYLQIASEFGLAGVALVVISVVCCGVWCARSLRCRTDDRVRLLAATITASLVANAIHAAVDFVWYVPGLMTMVGLLAACALRLDQIVRHREAHGLAASAPCESQSMGHRGVGVVFAGGTLWIAIWMFPSLSQAVAAEPFWFDYLRIALRTDEATVGEELDSTDAEETRKADVARFKRRLTALTQVIKRNPNHARANLRLASSCLTAFEHLQQSSENPMTLSQLRDAALASNFESTEAMRAWLERAVGSNLKYLDAAEKHAQRAVQLCPLQGQGYLVLAELAFLENLDPQGNLALLQQAERVRPHSAEIQFVIGRERLFSGELDAAMAAWKKAFHHDRGFQQQILDKLVGVAPAELIIQQLEPDLPALESLEVRFREMPRPQYEVIGRALVDALKTEASRPHCEQPVERLLSAAEVSSRLNDIVLADACFRRALEVDRTSYVARKTYGLFLYQQNQFARASEQLQWCLRINPGDEFVRKAAEQALAQQLKSDTDIQPAAFERPRRNISTRKR